MEECNNKHYAKGYCDLHYRRYLRYGNPVIRDNSKEYHGKSQTSEHRIWRAIKGRCLNPNNTAYKYYGGRGITICDKWCRFFSAFLKDMGERPFPKAQIDRIDNDGNYEPGNCRWTTAKKNIRNKSSIKLNLKTIQEIRKIYQKGNCTHRSLAQQYGVHHSTIGYIMRGKIWI